MGIIKKKSLKKLEEKASEARSLPMALSVAKSSRKKHSKMALPIDKEEEMQEEMAKSISDAIIQRKARKMAEGGLVKPSRKLEFEEPEGYELDTYDMRNKDAHEQEESEAEEIQEHNYAFGGEVERPSLEELNHIAGSDEDEELDLSDKIRRRMLSRRGV